MNWGFPSAFPPPRLQLFSCLGGAILGCVGPVGRGGSGPLGGWQWPPWPVPCMLPGIRERWPGCLCQQPSPGAAAGSHGNPQSCSSRCKPQAQPEAGIFCLRLFPQGLFSWHQSRRCPPREVRRCLWPCLWKSFSLRGWPTALQVAPILSLQGGLMPFQPLCGGVGALSSLGGRIPKSHIS